MDPLPMCYFRHRLFALSLAASGWLFGLQASAQSPWLESFESPTPSWKVAEADAPYRELRHERSSVKANTGGWSEHLRLTVGAGTTLLLAHDTPQFRVIDELSPSVYVLANRPGVQLKVRVVFPRAVDPVSGRPETVLLRGDATTQAGVWQQLKVADLRTELTREARLLRFRIGRDVDVREAYIDRVLLDVFSGQGETDVWIDDLAMRGGVESGGIQPVAYNERPAGPPGGPNEPPVGRVRMRGPVLLVDNRPFLPRMIEYRGEPLRFLKERGFNAIRLTVPPGPQLLAEAQALGLWIVSPPPPVSGATDPNALEGGYSIGEEYAGVLAWDLGHDLAARDLDRTAQLADEVRRADRFRSRPLICSPVADLRSYSRLVGAILAERAPLGTSLELADYGVWLRERPRLLAPGTPLWADIQTQLDQQLLEQQSLLSGKDQTRAGAEPEQIRLLVFQALAAGARGLSFRSSSPLDYQDSATRLRAKTLEALNLELELIEPFVAAGQLSALTSTGNRELTAAILQTENARLLLPIWCGPGAQYVPGQSAGNEISFVVPGVPAAHEPYELTPAGMQGARKQRVTGGTKVTLDDFGLTSMILITGDPRVQGAINSRTMRTGSLAAQLVRDLAVEKAAIVEQLDRTLTLNAQAIPKADEWREVARQSIQQAEYRLNAGDYQKAFEFAQSAGRAMRLMERAHWEAAATKLGGSPMSSPLAVSFATLPDHWRMIETLRGVQPGPSQLVGGNFENLQAMISNGWEHVQHPDANVKTIVELAPQAARSGKLGLRLRVTAANPATPPALIESPPVWVTSPPVRLPPGTWVRIHGWIKVASPIAGSVDGVMISESLGGRALAERIGSTKGWREITLYRVVNQSGAVTITIAMSGLGEAFLDDVTIEPLNGAGKTNPYPTTDARPLAPRVGAAVR
jgi:hypothetical protein